jgi:hypothetical protein
MTDDKGLRRPVTNPFSPTAVASVAEAAGMVSVPTKSTEAGIALLRAYIASVRTPPEQVSRATSEAGGESPPPAPGAAKGNVVAVVGDFGSGKTHLGLLLRNQTELENALQPPAHATLCVYLESDETLLSLYERFVRRVDEFEIYSQVREFYVTIVTTHFQGAAGDGIREMLTDPTLDPLLVASNLGLSEVALLDQLRRELTVAVKDAEFALVLSMLLRPGFRDRAWDWLRGAQPDSSLRERGVTSMIDNDRTALAAFTAITHLFGPSGKPLILFLDEAGKLLQRYGGSEKGEERLREFLQLFVNARALLLVAGLDEYLDLLGKPTGDRIGERITMAPFTSATTRDFVLECLKRTGRTSLAPFTGESIDTITELTYGNARRIGLYCRRLFAGAVREDRLASITAQHVREAARESFGVDTRREAARLVPKILRAHNWDYHHEYFVGMSPPCQVDFWIPVGLDSGCALIITEAVTDAGDTEKLVRHAEAVRAAVRQRGSCELLLIVSESVAPGQITALTEVFGREPLVYEQHGFEEELAAAVKGMWLHLQQLTGGDTILELRDRVTEMTTQQNRILDDIVQMRTELTSAGGVVRELRQDFGEVRQAVEAGDRLAAATLPDQVRDLFDQRLTMLAQLGDPEDIVRGFFDETQPPNTTDRLVVLHTVMRHPYDTVIAVGIATTARRLIEEFRSAIAVWFGNQPAPRGQRLREAEQAELQRLCMKYDDAMSFLPLERLDGLLELATVLRASATDRHELAQWPELSFRLRESLPNLAAAVRHAALAMY